MSLQIFLGNIFIESLSKSGIDASNALMVINISDSYVGKCTAGTGAGICCNVKILDMNRLCISKCRGTKYGSSFVSYKGAVLRRSTINQCYYGTAGADDCANIDSGFANFSDSNFSGSYNIGSSSYQLYQCSEINIHRVMHASGKSSHSIEFLSYQCPSIVKDSVFFNNTESYLFAINSVGYEMRFSNCAFLNNSANKIFNLISGRLPQITFVDVLILDKTPIGTGTPSYATSTSESLHTPSVGFSTIECIGFFKYNRENLCSLDKSTSKVKLLMNLMLYIAFNRSNSFNGFVSKRSKDFLMQ